MGTWGIGRRGFLAAGAALVAAMADSGCDDAEPAVRPPSRTPTFAREVHLDLSHLTQFSADDLLRLRMRVGSRRHELKAHTDETRAKFRGSPSVATRLTHYVEAAAFSAVGAQSYVVGLPNAFGSLTPVLAGIHIPPRDALQLRAGDPTPDPVTLDPTGAAQYCVFHHPSILSLDSDTARRVVDYITTCSSFSDLVDTITNAGQAQSPSAAADGAGGWTYAAYVLDKNEQRIPTVIQGEPQVGPDGSPRYRFRWASPPEVVAATAVTVAEVLKLIHNDPRLEGVKYLTRAGVASVDADARAASPVAGRLGAAEQGFDFVFPDQGVERGKRSHTVTRTSDTSFKLDVSNPNSLGCYVFSRALFPDGNFQNTPVGYVPGTFYASLSIVSGPSSESFTLDVPPGAVLLDITSSALAVSGGDLGGTKTNPRTEQEGSAGLALALIISGVLDVGMPTLMLAEGIGGLGAAATQKSVREALIADLKSGFLTTAFQDFFIEFFKLPIGEIKASDIFDFIGDLLESAAETVGVVLATKGLHSGVVLVKALIEGAGIEAAEESLPVIGWALEAAGIAADVAELALEAYDFIAGRVAVTTRLEPAHPVVLAVTPDATDPISIRFPQEAVTFEASITPDADVPSTWSGAFDPRQASVQLKCPVPVRLQGTLKADLTLKNPAGNVVGHATLALANETRIGALQTIALAMRAIPVPITPKTILLHHSRLAIGSSGRSVSSDLPAVADPALPCGDAARICGALGITHSYTQLALGYAFRTQQSCGQGAAGVQAQLLRINDPPKVAPSVEALACGNASQVVLSLLGGPSCVVASVPIDPDAKARYRVFLYDPAQPLPTTFDPKLAAGKLFGTALFRARVHANGSLVALTNAGVEVVDLRESAALGRPADPLVFTRRGSRPGQLTRPVSVAPLPTLAGYALLDTSPKRVHALDMTGNPLAIWSGSSTIFLPDGATAAGRELLDLDIDVSGNVWVLSFAPGGGGVPPRFTIDVYDKKGAFVVSFGDVPAVGIAADPLGVLYTENAESAVGPSGYAEPSISTWFAENPA